jgi:voltage-gated potassium channel
MTVITVATVGFHEVGVLSKFGRLFTIVLIFWGIGVGGYAIGTIAAFLVEGQMLELLKGRKMAKVITGLKDHIIVCGFGKIGTEVCARLAAAEQDFIVIDRDADRIDEALGNGYLAAVGEATDDEILEKAGIRVARGLISASCKKMIRAGADRVVSPFEIGARRMTALMLRPEIVEFLEAFAPDVTFGLRLEKVQLGESSSLRGVRLDHSYIKRDTNGAMVLAIEKKGQPVLINPPGETVLETGDLLLVIGNDEQLALLNKLAR